MSKILAAVGLATSLAFVPIVLAPTVASAQAIEPATTRLSHQVIRAGSAPQTPVLAPQRAGTPNASAQKCTREAAAKGLKGKPRKAFLAKCKKGSAGE